MPTNSTSFTRRFQEYSKILNDMAKTGQQKELYEGFLQNLTKLNQRINDLTEKSTPLSGPALTELKDLYKNAIQSTETYVKEVASINSGSAYVANEIARLLNKDSYVINRIPEKSEVRLQDAFRRARSSHIDIGTEKGKRVGGALSSRIPVEYVDENNVTRKGFFTPNYRIGDLSGLFKMIKARRPQYNDVWSALDSNRNQIERLMENYPALFTGGKPTKGNVDVMKEILNPVVYEKYRYDPDFKSTFRSFLGQLQSQFIRDDSYTSSRLLNADSKTSVTDRNCAMSSVAKLLGTTQVLANSERTVLYQNGNKIEGCFMDTAEGYDINNLNINDPNNLMWKWVQESRQNKGKPPRISSKAMKEIADLQVLDFVCGNVDRHGGNFLYKFAKDADGNTVLDGVMGIDNDNSFGKDTLVVTGKCFNMGLDAITAIPRSTADRLAELTTEKLGYMLADYGLSKKELDAAKERLTSLQAKFKIAEHITKDSEIQGDFRAYSGELYIVDDEKFADLNPTQFSVSTNLGNRSIGNIFDRIAFRTVISTFHDYTKKDNPQVYNPSAISYTKAQLVQPAAMTRDHIIERFMDSAQFSDNLYSEALWNTAEFKGMRTALKDIVQAPKGSTPEEMIQRCDTLAEKIKEYIQLKKDAPETHRGRERLSFARRLMDQCMDVKEDYLEGLMKEPGVPEAQRTTVVSSGDNMYHEQTIPEKLEAFKLTACDELKNALLSDNPETALEPMARILYFTKALDFARACGNNIPEMLLDEYTIQKSTSKVKDLAKDILANKKNELLEIVTGPNPGKEISSLAVSHLQVQKGQAAPKQPSRQVEAIKKTNTVPLP